MSLKNHLDIINAPPKAREASKKFLSKVEGYTLDIGEGGTLRATLRAKRWDLILEWDAEGEMKASFEPLQKDPYVGT